MRYTLIIRFASLSSWQYAILRRLDIALRWYQGSWCYIEDFELMQDPFYIEAKANQFVAEMKRDLVAWGITDISHTLYCQ